MTTQPRQTLLTADAFLDWATAQPRGRFELVRGRVVAMAPERLGHTRAKSEAWLALRTAIRERDLPCEAISDGASVRIDDQTVYEPDVLVRCGPKAPSDVVTLEDPVIVVEVVSPSSRGVDTGTKLADYLGLPSLRHYLVLETEGRTVTHHRRDEGGRIETRVLRDGTLGLDPPGIEIAVADVFATL
jgi:Uma2 family endonuclease